MSKLLIFVPSSQTTYILKLRECIRTQLVLNIKYPSRNQIYGPRASKIHCFVLTFGSQKAGNNQAKAETKPQGEGRSSEVRENRGVAMEKEDDFEKLLISIKTSEVVEDRIQLLTQLGGIQLLKESDLVSVLECLTILWDDYTHLDLSQCTLNKTVLHVAATYLKSETATCLRFFLSLVSKACQWCVKHLKMTLTPTGESEEEEHACLFFQLVLKLLDFSVACFSTVSRSPLLEDDMLRDTLENYILEELNLVKELITEIKRTSFASELLKASQSVLDAAIRHCRMSALAVNWDTCDDKDESTESSKITHVTNITKYTIETLCDLGILAANSGGSLVTILNLSWKGVVSLLQLGKGALAGKVNVAGIIRSLISLVNQSFKLAAEAWCSLEENISVSEAKRAFLPIKFYLINAIRICSQYPRLAYVVSGEIVACVLMICSFEVALSEHDVLKNVVEALEEHLKPTVRQLLNSLLNAAQMDGKQKLQILDWLFRCESVYSEHDDHISNICTFLRKTSPYTYEAMPRKGVPLIGRLALFIDLLRIAPHLEEDVVLGICRKLEWCLVTLTNEEVYSSVLALQIPVSCGKGNASVLRWQPLFSYLLHAMKVFMISISSNVAWSEFEIFLLENFFHSHFLCQEIMMQLWSFIVRHTEADIVNSLINKLCSLYTSVASSDSFLSPGSTLRKMARSMQMLLSSSTEHVVDRVYSFVTGDERPHLSMLMLAGLLVEGFQISSLSSNLKKIASERIIRDYIQFVEKLGESSMTSSDVFGIEVFILSAALQSLQVRASDIDAQTLKFVLFVIQSYRQSTNSFIRMQCCRLLSNTLHIVSYAEHLYGCGEVEEVILELQKMFIFGPAVMDAELHKCKSGLTFFMSGLASVEMAESDGNAKSMAIWDLYHMLLKERHWALVHLSTSSFGHFAARTCCNQLWRFVPRDAALAFDLESGTDPKEERFMTELKVLLEKETALTTAKVSSEQLRLAINEARALKEVLQMNAKASLFQHLENVGEFLPNKRQKLPDGLSQGMELLQSGLNLIRDGLNWKQQNHEIHCDEISALFANLEDTINHLAGLTRRG